MNWAASVSWNLSITVLIIGFDSKELFKRRNHDFLCKKESEISQQLTAGNIQGL